MLRIVEKEKLDEHSNPRIQKFAYEFFNYLTMRPKTNDEQVRLNHAINFSNNMYEFMSMMKNYIESYLNSVVKDELKDKNDYNSVMFDRILNGIKAYFKFNFYQKYQK